ncbi:MAG: hypothetical protein ABIP97_03595 [Chthoniobacterales bacterium]
MIKKICLIVFFTWSFGISAIAGKVAVLSSSNLQDAETTLVTALSSQPGVEVLERSKIDAIIREKGLATLIASPQSVCEAGRLLGADSLIVLEQSAVGQPLFSRLIAVEPSVVIDVEKSTWPIGDQTGWAKFLALRFAKGIRNLPKDSQSRALVSITGIRSTTSGATAAQTERECSLLIAHALVRLPGIFVLDRTRLRESDWEKQISGNLNNSYWSGEWLFDGNVTFAENRLLFNGRLQSAKGVVKNFQAEAADASLLADEIAKKIAENLQLPSTGIISELETTQYQAEAEWALKWKQYDQAERAADASWILGNHTESVAMLRILAAAVADTELPLLGGFYSSNPPSETLSRIGRAFSDLRQFTAVNPQWSPDINSYRKLTTLFLAASKVLQVYYFLPRERTEEEQQQLASVRKELRSYIPFMSDSGKKLMGTLKPYELSNLKESPDGPPVNFLSLYGLYGPLWSDSPEESCAVILKVEGMLTSLDPAIAAGLRKIIFYERGNHEPLVVAWYTNDQNQVPSIREKLFRDLQNGNPQEKLDAIALNTWRYYHMGLPELQKQVPSEVLLKVATGYESGLWDLRASIIDGTLPPKLISALFQLRGNLDITEAYKSIIPPPNTFNKRLFYYLLEQKWVGPQEIYGALQNGLIFSPAERDKALQALAAVQSSVPNPPRYLAMFAERISKSATNASDMDSSSLDKVVSESTASTEGIAPTRVFKISEIGSSTESNQI